MNHYTTTFQFPEQKTDKFNRHYNEYHADLIFTEYFFSTCLNEKI